MNLGCFTFEEFAARPLPAEPTSLLLIFNQEPEPALFEAVVNKALDEGAFSFMTWGLSAERYHDWIDEIDVWREIVHPETAKGQDEVTMTSWFSEKPVEEVGFFFMRLSGIDYSACRYLVLHHGPGPRLQQLRDWLSGGDNQ